MNFNDVLNQEQQRAALRRQRLAQQEYEANKAAIDNKYNTGLGGFFGDILGGIGRSIGNVGTGLYDMFGSAWAGLTGGNEGIEKFKKDLYKTDNLKDAYAKSAGTALNAATTLGTAVVPGLSAGTGAAKALTSTLANTAGGALSGIADELQQQGKDASIGGAANRAISGAAAGAAAGGVNKAIGNATGNISSKLLNNKLATSTIGRGAISGAVGGATGAGTSAALSGGDVAQAAIQGGLSGAAGGATQAGIMAGANRIGQGTRNKLWNFEANSDSRLARGLRGIGDATSNINLPGQRNKAYGIETYTPIPTEVEAPEQVEDEFRAYGDSELAKRTQGDQTAEALRRLGKTLEGSQTNITRAAANDLGIESAGGSVENVRKKTGLTNLETQAQIAKELTGGSNSLMDNVQRRALSATENGTDAYLADTTKLMGEVESIVKKYANRSNMKGQANLDNLVQDIRSDILSRETDLINKANNFKALAAELRGKGVVSPSEGDSAKAKIYSEVADKLDAASYSSIPKENVSDMFDVTINEMRARAAQAKANGNKEISNAYTKLANSLDKEPRTIQAYRSFKKDFVDISKINRLTAQAENGAAFQMASGAASGGRRFFNRLLQRPANAALAKAGGLVNEAADVVSDVAQPTAINNVPTPKSQPMSTEAQIILGNLIGRTSGQEQANSNVQSLRQAQELEALNTLYGGALSAPATQISTTNNAQTQARTQLDNIAGAMNNALAAGDMEAYSQLVSLYQTAYKMYEAQYPQTTSESKMSTAEKNQLAKLESAGTALDQLEDLYDKAGGGQGRIVGNIANFLSGLGFNDEVGAYNQLAQGLINQIGAAIGKTDSLNTEGEVQRALSLVPKITDTAQEARVKIATLRNLLQENTNTYNQLYGA